MMDSTYSKLGDFFPYCINRIPTFTAYEMIDRIYMEYSEKFAVAMTPVKGSGGMLVDLWMSEAAFDRYKDLVGL